MSDADYRRVFTHFVAKVEEAEDEGLSESQGVPIGLEKVDPTPGLLKWAENLRASLEKPNADERHTYRPCSMSLKASGID